MIEKIRPKAEVRFDFGIDGMVLNEFVEELDVAIKQDGHDIYCDAETAEMLKSLINDVEKHKICTIYATPPNDSKEVTTIKDIGEAFCNMESNDMIVDGFIISIDGKEIFSKELELKLYAPGDDCHAEYRCKFYVE